MEAWDPATDAALPVNFGAETLEQRAGNKTALLKEFSLDTDPRLPLLILISRMDQQKGVDLAVEGLAQVLDQPWQVILLGTGDPRLEEACRDLEAAHLERVRAAIRFDTRLSRRMYAGADVLLMPSRYEPCGLAQMMAMRYGCLPLARSTGGLRDTIVDADDPRGNATGFLFEPASAQAFAETLRRALALHPDAARWKQLQLNGMRRDFSWENSALQYVEHYKALVS
jgi:starch synthase